MKYPVKSSVLHIPDTRWFKKGASLIWKKNRRALLSKLILKYLEMFSLLRHAQLIQTGDILKAICMEADGRFALDGEPGGGGGGGNPEFPYAKLTFNGYDGLAVGIRQRRRKGLGAIETHLRPNLHDRPSNQ